MLSKAVIQPLSTALERVSRIVDSSLLDKTLLPVAVIVRPLRQILYGFAFASITFYSRNKEVTQPLPVVSSTNGKTTSPSACSLATSPVDPQRRQMRRFVRSDEPDRTCDRNVDDDAVYYIDEVVHDSYADKVLPIYIYDLSDHLSHEVPLNSSELNSIYLPYFEFQSSTAFVFAIFSKS